jgi:hypothetical protein
VAAGVFDGVNVFVDSLRAGCVGTQVAGSGGLNWSHGSTVGSGVAVGDVPPACASPDMVAMAIVMSAAPATTANAATIKLFIEASCSCIASVQVSNDDSGVIDDRQ